MTYRLLFNKVRLEQLNLLPTTDSDELEKEFEKGLKAAKEIESEKREKKSPEPEKVTTKEKSKPTKRGGIKFKKADPEDKKTEKPATAVPFTPALLKSKEEDRERLLLEISDFFNEGG